MFSKLRFRLASVILISCVLVFSISFFISNKLTKKSMNTSVRDSLNEVYRVDLVTSASDVSLYKTATVFLTYEDQLLTFTDSYSADILEKICKAIIKDDKNEGKINVGNLKIAYARKKASLNLETDYEDYFEYISGFKVYDEYIFVDYTDKYQSLLDSQQALLFSGFFLVILLSIVSFFISYRLIVPVEKSYKRERQLLGDVSHELKTPVAIITSNLETIENKKEDLIINQDKWLKNIKNQTIRMQYLIKELLNFSSHRTKLDKKNKYPACNISRTLEKIILSYEELAYKKGIKIEYTIADNIEYNCSKEDINKLFSILIDNAIKYNKDKGYINISLKEKSKKIVFSIKNSGHGIAPENINKIFDRFYRESYARTQENEISFGLGLSIAKSIVDYYKGQIVVRSELEVETEFEITFNKKSKKI